MTASSRLFKKSAQSSIRTVIAGALSAALLAAALLTGCAASNDASSQDASSASSSAASTSQTADNSAASSAEQAVSATVSITYPEDSEKAPVSYTVSLAEGATTVLDALAALSDEGIGYVAEDSQYGTYIISIDEVEAEGSSGWIYTVNGEQVMESADVCQLANGDSVEFEYITM